MKANIHNKQWRSVRAVADNPGQSLILYEDGDIRIHALDVTARNKGVLRTLAWKPSKSDRAALLRLIHKLNLVAAGEMGVVCDVCNQKTK